MQYEDAEKILLGETPAEDPTSNWTPEERQKIAELMQKVERPPEPEEVDLRRHFHKGQRIKDTAGLTTVVRSAGKSAMCVEVIGKEGRFVDNHQVRIDRFVFRTAQSKGRRTVFQLIGILPPKIQQGGSDGKAEAK